MSSVSDTAVSEPYGPPLSSADRVMHKILRLPLNPERISADAARKAMQTSLLVSTVRCLLQYIILPVVFPAVGLAGGVGSIIGMVIAVVAMIALYTSVRRFFRARHKKRWHYTVLAGAVAIGLSVLLVRDILAF
jgi:hypothetical protein